MISIGHLVLVLATAPPTTYNKWTSHFVSSGLIWVLFALGAVGLLLTLIRLLRKHRRARWLLLLPILPTVPLLASFARALFHLHPYAFAAAPVALIGLHWALKKRGHIGLTAMRVFLIAALLLTVGLPVSIVRLFMMEGDRCEEVARDGRIHSILSFCNPDWKQRIVRHTPQPYRFPVSANPRTVFPSSDGRSIYLGFGFRDSGSPEPLIKLSRSDGAIEKIYYLRSPYRGLCIREPRRCFLVSPMKRGLLVIDDAADRIDAEVRFVHSEPLAMTLDEDRRKLLVLPEPNANPITTSERVVSERLAERVVVVAEPEASSSHSRRDHERNRRRIWDLDWDSLSIRSHPPGTEAAPIGHMAYSGKHQVVIALPNTPSRSIFFAHPPGYALEEMPIGGFWNIVQSLGVGGGLVIDESRNRLYASYPLEGAIYVFNLADRRYEGKITVAPGIRELALDIERGVVFGGGYLDGKIYAVDLARARVADAFFVGRKIQQIHFEPDTRRLLVTSANGLLDVDVSGIALPRSQ